MRFIRDIIAERSEIKDEPPQDGPQNPGNTAGDRTMTRLSDSLSLNEDDVFNRLMQEEAARDAATQPNIDAILAEEDREAENLFENLDSDAEGAPEQDADAPEDDPSSRMASDQRSEGESRRDVISQPRPEEDQIPADMQTDADDSDMADAGIVAVPAPASGRSGRGAGRVKTRLLGFGPQETPVRDPFQDAASGPTTGAVAAQSEFPVGWIVVIDGPGTGQSFALTTGVSQIGRGDDQAIRLNFGDTSISRSNHAAVAFDAEQDGFYLGHGGKANMVRLNDRPVLSTEELKSGAIIRIGETTLRFVAFCDGAFSWSGEATPADARRA